MIREIMKSNVRRCPDKIAVIFKDTRYTYKEFNDRVNRLANALTRIGLKKGDWLAVVGDGSMEHVEIFWAAAKVGIITSALNQALSHKDLAHIIGHGKAAAVICGHKYCDLIESVRPQCKSLKGCIGIGIDESHEGFTSYEGLISSSPAIEPDMEIDEDDLLYFANTSGTTGLSKQVVHTYRSLFATALMDFDALGYDMEAGSVSLVSAPLFWAYLLPRVSIPPFYTGSSLVIPEDLSPQTILKTIEKEQVTRIITGTPFFQPLMDHPDLDKYNISSLRQIFIFGYFPPEAWRKAIELFGKIFILGYGSSEIGFISFLPSEDFTFEESPGKPSRIKSCGREAFGVEARVINDKGEDVQPGEMGEVIAKGQNMMKGYWNAPTATEQTIRGGFIYTGDLATIDEDGYIYLAGRKKDCITTQGKMVMPQEIEEVILGHPNVVEVAVIGLPDEELGEMVKAIVLRGEEDVTTEEIIDLCRKSLPDYAVPGSVDFAEFLPKTDTGRVQRYKLIEQYMQVSTDEK